MGFFEFLVRQQLPDVHCCSQSFFPLLTDSFHGCAILGSSSQSLVFALPGTKLYTFSFSPAHSLQLHCPASFLDLRRKVPLPIPYIPYNPSLLPLCVFSIPSLTLLFNFPILPHLILSVGIKTSSVLGNPLAVQWLGHRATAEGTGSDAWLGELGSCKQ